MSDEIRGLGCSLEWADERAEDSDFRCAQDEARASFALLFDHVMRMATCGDTASLPAAEAYELLDSICFTLGVDDLESPRAVAILRRPDLMERFCARQERLRQRAQEAMELWERVNRVMPPVRNIALRDTLISLGSFKRRYDVLFAAHQVPCDIDYPLSCPVSERLRGVDYVTAWLEQLLREAECLARFSPAQLEEMLAARCPDPVGLHVNLYDVVFGANAPSRERRGCKPGGLATPSL